ncbi:Unknown protein [Striga hermonthica]|uniref:DUF4408 domain-containing protein n=1 Tax=Striga hermonthica TaxID=68872 RepID=A0A9N7R2B0_STRHE|nr:Unknown protein [Striga hermonthica]
MDSFKFYDARAEKSNAILRHRRSRRFTAVFRCLELLVFLLIASRFSTRFTFDLNLSAACFRGISVTLISPRFVFLVGNAIVVALFLISGRFSGGGGAVDFYEEYAGRSRSSRRKVREEERKELGGARVYGVVGGGRRMGRCRSEVVEREKWRRDLRRSASEKCRKSGGGGECGRRAAEGGGGGAKYAYDLFARVVLTDCQAASTPLDYDVLLIPLDDSLLEDPTLYRQLVES